VQQRERQRKGTADYADGTDEERTGDGENGCPLLIREIRVIRGQEIL
jgi:hypothetical protein